MNKFVLKGLACMFLLAILTGTAACGDKEDPTVVSVIGVALDKTTASVKPGEDIMLTATITPADASDKSLRWTSSDTKIASVDAGKVTGVAVGEVTITVTTVDGNKTATCVVTVATDAPSSQTVILKGNITENRTLRKVDNNYLQGFVYVKSGVVLTIEPGAVVKGNSPASGEKAAALIIEPGGKIIAEGTVNEPIVFTSAQPAGQRDYGDWGGLILCGNARVNCTSRPVIEGGPGTYYGAVTDADAKNEESSGILKYVRIEFAGYPLEPNKEINGLTFGGVGSGTIIQYVQVSYCGDDSFEWFGGTVNAKNLVAYKGWDDEFDTDFGYSGMLQFLLGVRDPKHADTSKSNGFESDNDAEGSSNKPTTTPIFSNVTLIGPLYGISAGKADADILYNTADASNGAKGGQFQAAMHIRRNSSLQVYNSVFTGWPYGLFFEKNNVGATVKNVIFAGMWKDFKNTESETYFNNSALGNMLFASTNDIITTNALYSSVVKDKITGAGFTDTPLTNSFFEKVSYKGAFDGTDAGDWTKGWTNWDPQNEVY